MKLAMHRIADTGKTILWGVITVFLVLLVLWAVDYRFFAQ